MARRSKRYRECRQMVDRTALYSVEEAVEKLKAMKHAKFDEAVELTVQLGIDPKQSDQQVRGSISLPHGIGKTLRAAVFASGEKAEEARQAGADFVGAEDLVEKVRQGWLDFDVALATPDMMRLIAPLGRILGPRGLMPSPKSGTVTQDIADAVKEFKAGRVEFRNDSGGNVHGTVGRLSFSTAQLVENVQAMVDCLLSLRPAKAKGRYLKKVVLSSTMSPGLRVAVESLR